VAGKAVRIAEALRDPGIDVEFIHRAAMLHDIGIFYADAPAIGCFGAYPYICHGYLGRDLLSGLGLEKEACVAERHVGAGLSVWEIEAAHLPLPVRDMIPRSIEEQIICVADKFFSKSEGLAGAGKELDLQAVIAKIRGYGKGPAARFESWLRRLNIASESRLPCDS